MSEISTEINKISYSLFSPKKTYEHRFWDKSKNDLRRYWFNIPAIHAINKFLMPSFKNFFYVNEEVKNDKLFSFIENVDSDNYCIVNEEYSGHEPSFWRIKPLWEKNVKVFLSRDIDSIFNEAEYKSFITFRSSKELVSTIRSHENHYGYPCRMLMGLSAFKPKLIPENIKTKSFHEFKEKYSVRESWDNDQLTLINCFTSNDFFTSEFFLDFKVNNQEKFPDFFCKTLSEKDLNNIELSKEQKYLFDYIKSNNLSDWSGQPTDVRGKHLLEICEITQSKEIISLIKDLGLSDFYL